MPITVPRTGRADMPLPIPSAKPTETDLMMALSVMAQHPSFNERFAGEPPGLPIDIGQRGPAVTGIGKDALRTMKQLHLNAGTSDVMPEPKVPGTDDPMKMVR